MKKQLISIMASVLMLVGSGRVMAVTQYAITDLGNLQASGINNSGWVVGTSAGHAFLYNGATMKDLGTLGGSHSYATGINDSGQVVGYSDITGNSTSYAFLYDGTTMKNLGF